MPDVVDEYEKQYGTKNRTLWNTAKNQRSSRQLTANDYLLTAVSKKRFNPRNEPVMKTIYLELLEEEFMVNLIKGFCIVKIYTVRIKAILEVSNDLIKMIKKLCETTLAGLKTMLMTT